MLNKVPGKTDSRSIESVKNTHVHKIREMGVQNVTALGCVRMAVDMTKATAMGKPIVLEASDGAGGLEDMDKVSAAIDRFFYVRA